MNYSRANYLRNQFSEARNKRVLCKRILWESVTGPWDATTEKEKGRKKAGTLWQKQGDQQILWIMCVSLAHWNSKCPVSKVPICEPFNLGELKGTELRWQRRPKTQIESAKTADFRRFTPSPGNSIIRRAQEPTEDRWFSQETTNFRRKPQETADWAPLGSFETIFRI